MKKQIREGFLLILCWVGIIGSISCWSIGFADICGYPLTRPKSESGLSYETRQLIHSMKKLEGWKAIGEDYKLRLYNDNGLCVTWSGTVYKMQDDKHFAEIVAFAKDAPALKEAFEETTRRLSVTK